MKKNIIFIVIFSFLFYISNILLNQLDRKTFNFINFSNKNIDILFLGTSHSYSTFNTRLIDNKLKIDSVSLASDSQPIEASYYLLKEFYKKHEANLVIFELYSLASNNIVNKDSENGNYYNVINSFPIGVNKYEALKISTNSPVDYLIPVLKYHATWKNINQIVKNVIALFPPPYKGSVTYWRNTNSENLKYENIPNKNFTINPIKLKYLEKIQKLAYENNSQILFVIAPVLKNSNNIEVFSLKEKLEKMNINVLDFNNLNLSKEYFLDNGHLNTKGAIKVSENLTEFLKNYKFKSDNFKANDNYDEFYLYNNNLNKVIFNSNLSNVKNIILIPKRKNLSSLLNLLDSFNVGVVKKEKIIQFFKTKYHYNLYIELSQNKNSNQSYQIDLYSKHKLVKSINKDNSIYEFKDNKNEKKFLKNNDIWEINNKFYLIEFDIFINNEIDYIEIKNN